MHIEEFRAYCLQKAEVTEGFPFNETTLVFKVAGKMFALTDIEGFESINLKCDPERAVQLRESFAGIRPGYHMNKTLWNTVETRSDVDDMLLYELIDHSYAQVVAGLPKKIRDVLQNR
jgi:predicted DNA-binding protein (MmcQ/YjbR family)